MTGINQHRIEGSNWIRKSQCNYGWDWGPICVTCGVWKDIEIKAYSVARIENVQITQDHSPDKVDLNINIELEKSDDEAVKIEVDVQFKGTSVTNIIMDEAGSKINTVW